jgi:amidophosphoribosyltransferase
LREGIEAQTALCRNILTITAFSAHQIFRQPKFQLCGFRQSAHVEPKWVVVLTRSDRGVRSQELQVRQMASEVIYQIFHGSQLFARELVLTIVLVHEAEPDGVFVDGRQLDEMAVRILFMGDSAPLFVGSPRIACVEGEVRIGDALVDVSGFLDKEVVAEVRLPKRTDEFIEIVGAAGVQHDGVDDGRAPARPMCEPAFESGIHGRAPVFWIHISRKTAGGPILICTIRVNSITPAARILDFVTLCQPEDEGPKEECGVLGVYAPGQEAARIAFFGLFALQHRGQESAGIAVSDGFRVRMHKDMGLVSQVFNSATLESLPGHMAVGHTRYSTTGASVLRNAQPIYCQSLVGEIAVAHNGNLINTRELREKMQAEGEHFDSTSDTELIARIIVRHLPEGPEAAVNAVMAQVEGAYSVTVVTPNLLIAFRDPAGIRPMVVGKLDAGYMIASETCAFGPVGAHFIHELDAGEMAIVQNGELRIQKGSQSKRRGMCLFEFIYFARPDSQMYGSSLYSARERMGARLCGEHPVEADIVVPVPDSGIPAALGFSRASGIPFREGMTKSRYIHRTFIQPDQRMRELGVRMKLTPLEDHIRGQRVVLVDDSIVRGTTTKQIVKMMFESGAREVHVRITAPPIKFPCFYGIDMASKGELASARMTVAELGDYIGASSLGFLSIEGACAAVLEGNPELVDADDKFCLACFNGDYKIPVPGDMKKHAFDEPPEVGEMSAISTSQLTLID